MPYVKTEVRITGAESTV